jgi:uncharacterized protein (TIGR03435 family)
LINAYDVKDFQVVGPDWLDTETFQVDATMPPDTTKAQLREMFQNLLAERFKLKVHRETKELPVYSLALGKNGPKMKESAVPPPAGKGKEESDTDADGFPILPMPAGGLGGISTVSLAGVGNRIRAQQATTQDLVNELMKRQLLGRPVKDETTLKAKYDFVLTFSSMGLNRPSGAVGAAAPSLASPAAAPTSLLDLFQAMQSQLGLKLESKKGPVEIIIIDHVERVPAGN